MVIELTIGMKEIYLTALPCIKIDKIGHEGHFNLFFSKLIINAR